MSFALIQQSKRLALSIGITLALGSQLQAQTFRTDFEFGPDYNSDVALNFDGSSALFPNLNGQSTMERSMFLLELLVHRAF